jgi:hypothetical protein
MNLDVLVPVLKEKRHQTGTTQQRSEISNFQHFGVTVTVVTWALKTRITEKEPELATKLSPRPQA